MATEDLFRAKIRAICAAWMPRVLALYEGELGPRDMRSLSFVYFSAELRALYPHAIAHFLAAVPRPPAGMTLEAARTDFTVAFSVYHGAARPVAPSTVRTRFVDMECRHVLAAACPADALALCRRRLRDAVASVCARVVMGAAAEVAVVRRYKTAADRALQRAAVGVAARLLADPRYIHACAEAGRRIYLIRAPAGPVRDPVYEELAQKAYDTL